MYSEIDFPLTPEQRQRLLGQEQSGAHCFRKAVARGATAIGWDGVHGLLHYSAQGTPMDGQAPVWFQTYKNGVRVTAVGPAGAALLAESILPLHRVIAAGAGGIVAIVPRSGECTIGLGRPTTYVTGALSFVYKHKKAWWWGQVDQAKKDVSAFLDAPGVRDELAGIIKRSLTRAIVECHGTGALETGGDTEVSLAELERRLVVRVDSARRILFMEEGKGRTLALKGVEITTNAALSGPWAVGRFASRGDGIIRREMSGDVAFQESA